MQKSLFQPIGPTVGTFLMVLQVVTFMSNCNGERPATANVSPPSSVEKHRRCVAQFLHVSPGTIRMQFLHTEREFRVRNAVYRCTWNDPRTGQPMTAIISLHLGTLLYVSDVDWDVGTGEKSRAARWLTKEEALRVARQFVDDHYPISVNRFEMTVEDRHDPWVTVSWLEEIDAHTISGAIVSASVDRRIGRVISYGARLVPPDVPKPRITAEQAMATARQNVGKLRGKLTFDANVPQLLLSSPFAPKEGPVWAVGYHLEWTVKGHLIETGAAVTIDAVTGKVISLAELPFGIEENPTQTPSAPAGKR